MSVYPYVIQVTADNLATTGLITWQINNGNGVTVVSSRTLSYRVGISPAQVRADLEERRFQQEMADKTWADMSPIPCTGTASSTTFMRGDGSWAVPPVTTHTHAESDITNLVTDLAGKAAVSHTHVKANITDFAHTHVKADITDLGAGSDPWTILKLATDFTTGSATAVDVTGLAFTPAANQSYMFEGMLFLRTASATVNPRPGLAWPTGMTDGVVQIDTAQTATTQLTTRGNIGAAVLVAVGGLPNATQSWPSSIWGAAIAGTSPSGTIKVQLASETAATNVTIKAGSFLRWRVY